MGGAHLYPSTQDSVAGNLCEFKANLVYIVTSQASYGYTVIFCLKEEEDEAKRKI